MTIYGTRNRVEERRPSATTLYASESAGFLDSDHCGAYIELGGALVEGCSTSSARVYPLRAVFVIFAGSRPLCSFLAKDSELNGCERFSVQFHCGPRYSLARGRGSPSIHLRTCWLVSSFVSGSEVVGQKDWQLLEMRRFSVGER